MAACSVFDDSLPSRDLTLELGLFVLEFALFSLLCAKLFATRLNLAFKLTILLPLFLFLLLILAKALFILIQGGLQPVIRLMHFIQMRLKIAYGIFLCLSLNALPVKST